MAGVTRNSLAAMTPAQLALVRGTARPWGASHLTATPLAVLFSKGARSSLMLRDGPPNRPMLKRCMPVQPAPRRVEERCLRSMRVGRDEARQDRR